MLPDEYNLTSEDILIPTLVIISLNSLPNL